MRVYLAAPFPLRYLINSLAGELRRAGVEVVSRWHDPASGHGKGYTGDYAQYADADRAGMNQEAMDDLADIRLADTVICFTQPPKTTYTSGGRHVELGYALALGKIVFVVGPIENVFCNLANGVYGTWDELLTALKLPPIPADVPRTTAP
jgi:nucleoside 2-deoxyribosyltransferase